MKKKLSFLLIIFILIMNVFNTSFAEKKYNGTIENKELKILMLVPTEGKFWEKLKNYSFAVAEDLSVSLDVLNYDGNFDFVLEKIEEYHRDSLDGLIINAIDDPDEKVFRLIERYKIPTFTFEGIKSSEDFLPRSKYSYWIGDIKPDDKNNGSLEIQQLLNIAKENGETEFNILSIQGPQNEVSSVERNSGMSEYLKYISNISHLATVTSGWNREKAKELFKEEYVKNEKLNIVWCASDLIALGVMEAIKELEITKPIYVGGIDWIADSIKAVEEGEMSVTIGGHYFSGGSSVLLLHDYLKGKDFSSERLSFVAPMYSLNKNNYDTYKSFLQINPSDINFKQYSKVYDSKIRENIPRLTKISEDIEAAENYLALSREEKEWLKAHPVIRVHNEINWPPFNFNKRDIPQGLSIDYMNLIAERLGIEIEYVTGPSWNEFIEMVKQKNIDIMLNIVKTPEREKFLNFTEDYVKNPSVIVSKKDNKIKDIDSLNGKTVAVPKGFFYQEILERDYPEIQIHLVNDVLEALKAVLFDEADVAFGEEAVVEYLTNENLLTDLEISGELNLGDEEFQKLNIGVRKDWPELRNILQKSLNVITNEEKSKITDKWMSLVQENVESKNLIDLNSSKILIFNNIYKLITLIVVIFIIVYIFFLIQRKIFGDINDKTQLFSSHKIRIFGVNLLAMIIIIVIIITGFGLSQIKEKLKSDAKESLRTILNISKEGLIIWVRHNLKQLELDAADPELISLVEKQLVVNREKQELLSSETLKELRKYFSAKHPNIVSLGFFIISPDYINIGSMRDENIGQINLIYNQRKELLEEVFQGKSNFIPPIWSDVKVTDIDKEIPPTMFYCVPIKDKKGRVIAALTLREIPMEKFSQLVKLGRVGQSGETYAFDKKGLMLTESRFDEELKEIGLLTENESSMLNIKILNPEVDLTKGESPKKTMDEQGYTLMIQEALKGESEVNIDGYRDYRGKKVFGAWFWDDNLNFGLATEIDVEDALGSYNTAKKISLIIISLTILLTSIATFLSIFIGEKANKILGKSKDDLEEKVVERTKELLESNKTLENTIEALTHPFYVVDAKTCEVILANSAAKLAIKEEEISTCYRSANGSEMLCNSEEDPCLLSKVMKTKTPYELEHIRYDKNNKPINVEIHGYPIFDEYGEVVQMIEYSLDITKRKRAEEEIKKLNSAIEQSPVSVIITDLNGIIQYVNPAFSEITGYSFDEAVGQNPSILKSGEHSKEFYDKMWSTIKLGNTWKGEIINRKKNGEKYWEHASISPVLNERGEIISYITVKNDITEKKKAETDLELLNQLVYGSLESANVGAWWRDFTEEDTFHALDITIKMLGLTVSDSKEKAYRFSSWREVLNETAKLNDEYKSVIEESFEKLEGVISGKYEYYNALYPVLQNDKSIKWINSRANVPKRDKDGRALMMTGTLIDVTELKKIEQELLYSKKLAEEATKAKGDFLANMSHEIRTPMNAIIGLNNLLEKTNLNKKQQDYVNKIGRSSKNLLGIINDILDFSKIEAGKLILENIEFSLEDILENLSSVVSLKAFQKGLEFIIAKNTDVPLHLMGDPLRIGQILLNLSNNAIKFTEVGEVSVKVELIEKYENEVLLKFSVNDTGIGLKPEQSEKLFKAFSQADTSTTRKYGGTGLGLSISKKLTELMGGEIGVESVFEKGSSFYFTAKFQIGEEAKKKVHIIPENIKNLKVLVADDNETAREVMEDYIKGFSFEVTLASSGEETLSYIKSNLSSNEKPYDVIFLDWQMQGINGVETWNKIKELYSQKKLPKVIMLTAYGREEVIRSAKDAAIVEVLMKPVNHSVLYDTILQSFGEEVERNTFKKIQEDYPEGFDNIRGSKILLVEDNDINQQVAKETLENEGFWVTIANDGQESIDILKENSEYDIVLMDLQMPVLDGYEATMKIRENPEWENLPIIALSADAMQGTKEKVIEKGMNGYLSKPIEVKELFAVLLKWIKVKERKPLINENIKEENEDEALDIEKLRNILTEFKVDEGVARLGGKIKSYVEILKKFKNNNTNSIKEIIESLKNNEKKEAERILHTLKGVAGNIGATTLQAQAGDLESELGNSTPEVIGNTFYEKLSSLDKNLELIFMEITELIELQQENQLVSGKNISVEELVTNLKLMNEYLEDYNSEALTVYDKISKLTKGTEYLSEIKKIGEVLGQYEFEEALERSESLIKKLN